MPLLPFEESSHELLTKRQAKTDKKFGSLVQDRPLNLLMQTGIINLNKTKGPTSHQVASYVQDILGIQKCGHSGTLDPAVTGVLPVALSRGTRIVSALLTAGKEYVGIMRIHSEVTEPALMKGIESFIGKINQLPPVRSSVKRQMRERTIYYFDILEIDKKDVLFRVGCQAGTYIRKLVHDLGLKLGTGANMQQLVRTKAGPFKLEESWTLNELRDALWFYKNEGNEKYIKKIILPVESGVFHLPKIYVLDSAVSTLCHGAFLCTPGISQLESDIEKDDVIAVMTLKGELICLGTSLMSSDEMLTLEKGVAVKPTAVFMEPGVYPKITTTE